MPPTSTRQEADVAAFRKDEALAHSRRLRLRRHRRASPTEVRQKLERHRPGTLAQAARIDGITPAALLLLLAHLKTAAGAEVGLMGRPAADRDA